MHKKNKKEKTLASWEYLIKKTLKEIKNATRTHIVFESNHRILKFLKDLLEVLGHDRVLCIARELTKLHETILTGPAGKVMEAVKSRSQKGEFVVVIAPTDFEL